MKWILDPSFRYTPSHQTDIRKTFERVRRTHEAGARGALDSLAPQASDNVRRLDPRKASSK
ncbi:MAG TPA: hypothetical protein VH600_21920 [Burkholderiales bacterium]|jgi:hypothetical protein